MVRTARFAFDDDVHGDRRDWGREWDDLGDEFPEPDEAPSEPEEAAVEPNPQVVDDEPEVVEPSPRHLADADWLRPRRVQRRKRAG